MSYTVLLGHSRELPKIVVVGCGGTGGFVVEGLCRLMVDSDLDLLLVDHDRVEDHNLRRQNFFKEDLGKFKSQVLAERLARQYGRQVAYSVYPYERSLINEDTYLGTRICRSVIIGCVDGPDGRRDIAKGVDWNDWWLDAGNGYQYGQVLIGNTATVEGLKEAFNEADQTVDKLPMPSLQLPSLLSAHSKPAKKQRDCAEAVEDNLQSPIINQAMASMVLEFAYKLLSGTLTWMGAYLDLESGSRNYIPAEPKTIAKMFGVKVDTLMLRAGPETKKRVRNRR